MNRGDQNVLDRLVYAWIKRYGPDHVPREGLLADWELAKNQLRATWLTQEIEDIILRRNKPL